jgi:hypothetical protein
MTAAKLYIEYLVGRPVQAIEVSVPEEDTPLIPPALQQAIVAVPGALEVLRGLDDVLSRAAEPAARNGREELRRVLDDAEAEKRILEKGREIAARYRTEQDARLREKYGPTMRPGARPPWETIADRGDG